MGKKLEVDIKRFDNIVLAKITHQDESLRNTDEVDINTIINNYNYSIVSAICPEITEYTLYIRGKYTQHDNDWVCKIFTQKADAKEWIKKISKLVCEVNTNIGYKLKINEPVQVRDDENNLWKDAYFATYIPNAEFPYKVFTVGDKNCTQEEAERSFGFRYIKRREV